MPVYATPLEYQGDSLVFSSPGLDTDFLIWASAVEDTGATFGPDAEAIATNKTAWNNWVIAQKNAASPIAGRTNWQQLTQAGEGYIQPMMGVSTFNVPPLFGGSTFTGFVSGDFNPATGLKGGANKSLQSNRFLNSTPLDDVSIGMWTTGAASSSAFLSIFGSGTGAIFTSGVTRLRANPGGVIPLAAYNGGSFPRAAFVSRHQPSDYLSHSDSEILQTNTSVSSGAASLFFFAASQTTAFADITGGLAFYGRSINLTAMDDACAALSEAIVWP